MSTKPYAALVVHMYEFPKSQIRTVERLQREDGVAAIEAAIAGLADKPSGDRMQVIVRRCYGIGCNAATLRQIGTELDPSVKAARVAQLRNKAEWYILSTPDLRPLMERITAAGIDSFWTEQTLRLLLPSEWEQLLALSRSELDRKQIDAFGLSDRTEQCLKNRDIITFGELRTKSDAELMQLPSFDRKSLQEVKSLLASCGESLHSPGKSRK